MKIIDSITKEIGKFLIRVYQKTLSFDHSFWGKQLGVRVCVHYPSCSEYTYQSIDRFGLVKGSVMGLFRILRCTPATKCHYDPVPDKFSIKANCDS